MGTQAFPPPGTPPTAQELRVLWYIAHGLGSRETGRRLGLSRDTVKSHLRRVARRLGAHGAGHAIAICHRKGLFPPAGHVVLTAAEQEKAAGRG